MPPMRYSLNFTLPSGNVWVWPTSMPVFGSPTRLTSGTTRVQPVALGAAPARGTTRFW